MTVQYQRDSHVTVGGLAPNVFVGGRIGVEAWYSDHVVIEKNYIGMTPGGRIIPNRTGISFDESNNNIASGNTIRGNGTGVRVLGNSIRNQILDNSMRADGLGIDLSSSYFDGATPNDAGDGDLGPNNLINFPVLGRATIDNGTMTVTGTLSTAPNRSHRIQLFASDTCNASGHGEGTILLADFEATTNGAGEVAFTRNVAYVAPGSIVTATATSSEEGTSEFSPCVTVEGAGAFSFQSETLLAGEGQTVTMTVRRLGGAAGPASVSYGLVPSTATPGVDFTGGTGTLDFADGQTSANFTIPIVDDALYEGDERIIVALSGPTAGTTLAYPDRRFITIRDDDAVPTLTVTDLQVAEGHAGPHVAQIRVTISGAIGNAYQANYSFFPSGATPGSDYIATPGTLTFLPGETEKYVPVTIIGDGDFEDDEYFEIFFLNGGPQGTVTILNDDSRPVISIANQSAIERNATWTALITLTASAPATGGVSVSLLSDTARSPGDFIARTDHVSFYNQTTVTVPVTLNGDDLPEANESFRVVIQRYAGDLTVGATGTAEATFTILNDDVGVGPAERSVALGERGAFAVELGSEQPHDVVIALSSDSPNAVSVPATLLIRAGTSFAEFEATALAADLSATIQVTFPPALGGTTHQVRVRTYPKATLHFTPARVQMFEGGSADVTVSVDPPAAMTIGLVATGPVRVPSSVAIPAGGVTTFTVTATGRGAFTIDAQLPAQHGNEVQSLFGDVLAAPITPAIGSITPSHGPTSGGTAVTVSGANLRAGCAIVFGGSSATAVQFGNGSTLTATTPAHVRGSVDVSLVCGSDAFEFRNGFTYVSETPHIVDVRPATGTTQGGTEVRVNGAHFDGSCWLFFGNAAATNVVVRDSNLLTAATPAQSPGNVDVTVRCTGGTFAAASAFAYRADDDPAPLITAIEPSAAAPGELVTVRGLGFRRDDVAKFDTTPAIIADVFPDLLVVRVPELSAMRVSVLVTDLSGRTTTSGPVFSVLEARPPRITSVAPSTTPAGGELALTGEGFRPGYTFEIGGSAATIVTSDYTHAIVRIARGVTAGMHPVEIHNSTGALASVGPNVHIVGGDMILNAVEPSCTTTDGGIFGTIRGSGFVPGVSVAFDGTPATDVSLVDVMTLRVRIPAGVAGPARITIAAGTNTATLTNGFTYDSPFAPRDSCGGRVRAARH